MFRTEKKFYVADSWDRDNGLFDTVEEAQSAEEWVRGDKPGTYDDDYNPDVKFVVMRNSGDVVWAVCDECQHAQYITALLNDCPPPACMISNTEKGV